MKVLVNLYIVLHMFPISSAISSAFSKKSGPEIKKDGLWEESDHQVKVSHMYL